MKIGMNYKDENENLYMYDPVILVLSPLYVATLQEQVEQEAEERTPESLPRVSRAILSDYSEKIEAIASKLAAPPVRSYDLGSSVLDKCLQSLHSPY
ncbi:unnamed protein product [Prunus armeniaca]|uniref:Exocyst complex component Sec8 n=1 Tax=Prunus armeniaca TaxID=36596 RepID=A0A6J5W116_PRUAR|nr:unnamed protein product [Prunus armeniaca]